MDFFTRDNTSTKNLMKATFSGRETSFNGKVKSSLRDEFLRNVIFLGVKYVECWECWECENVQGNSIPEIHFDSVLQVIL